MKLLLKNNEIHAQNAVGIVSMNRFFNFYRRYFIFPVIGKQKDAE
jgi:hypothetical protein